MNTKKDFCSKVLLANMLLHLPKWEEISAIMIKHGAKETWCTKNQIEDALKRAKAPMRKLYGIMKNALEKWPESKNGFVINPNKQTNESMKHALENI